MRHLTVLIAALLLFAAAAGATLRLGRLAAADQQRVTAVFPPGTSPASIMAAVSHADGRLVRETLLPFAVEVESDEAGIAVRLEATGALIVLARLPVHGLAVGGCSYGPADAYAGPAARRAVAPTWVRPL